jgi:rubrerythrin
MPIQFNPDEIFTMAEQIEKNGARFYRAAAKNNPSSGPFLLNLAAMEDEHCSAFEEMHGSFSDSDESDVFDPDGEAGLYLAALAGGKVFDMTKDPVDLLKGNETLEEIILCAIGLEKDSIVFYLGMKELVMDRSGREKIDLIIKEEMQHIVLLTKKLQAKQ